MMADSSLFVAQWRNEAGAAEFLALHERVIVVPHWTLIAPFAITLGVAALPLVRRRHRRRSDHCARCGYDLRGTPERCPECGGACHRGRARGRAGKVSEVTIPTAPRSQNPYPRNRLG